MAQNRAFLIFVHLTLCGAVGLVSACGKEEKNETLPVMKCTPGQTQQCPCADGTTSYQACDYSTLTFRPCQCSAVIPTAGAPAEEDTSVEGVTTATGLGSGGRIVAVAGTSGRTTGAGGAGARGGAGGRAGSGSNVAGAGGKTTTTGSAGTAGTSSTSTDDLNDVRQLCVDTINKHRATESLTALKRASPEVEACSDEGAKQDGIANQAHGSAGNCSSWKMPGSGLMGGQDTCPNWPVGGWAGGTLGDSLTKCLQQMWDEKNEFVTTGKTRQECQQDYQGCFLKYGHYLNMSNTQYTTVSCGFYETKTNTWWMNQDF
jgi:hypothetical protein